MRRLNRAELLLRTRQHKRERIECRSQVTVLRDQFQRDLDRQSVDDGGHDASHPQLQPGQVGVRLGVRGHAQPLTMLSIPPVIELNYSGAEFRITQRVRQHVEEALGGVDPH